MKYAAVFGALVIFMAGCSLNQTASVEGQSEGTSKKVLIVTGIDHPAHEWKKTAPALAEVLGQDTRMEVDVVEQPDFLGTDNVHDYDVVVVHFMSWEKPTPSQKARANLKKFVSDGKGLFVLHFGCGAFRDWPEYRNLVGRIWDPNLRAHDPRGPFRVDIVNKEHPITRGMASFQTEDELYTCLAGERPIDLLATARSKVDGKDYPMAFVLKYGKGRVFHCALGHDVKAIENPPAAELLRRGCAWTAGLTPVSTAAN
ncbi:MAG: ThuA domain-containing protein [Sedimentisphaerales bacterium]|jgi:type 1 glutamine amidotransferase